jgi:HD-GYP domain-containing protein (c-di-GMP phosphodiesterase class II)
MSDPREILHRIAALKQRLDLARLTPTGPRHKGLREGADHDVADHGATLAVLDRELRTLEETAPAPMPAKLTSRAARLVQKARVLLHELKPLAEHPLFETPTDPLAELHRDTVSMVEVILRTIQAFPPSPSAQLRLCEGLESLIAQVDGQVSVLQSALQHRQLEVGRIDLLADQLHKLWTGSEARLEPLQALADDLQREAQHNQPLRFLSAPVTTPRRFLAAHGLNTAQVLARMLLKDQDWLGRQQEALIVAMVHDVGMLGVPPEILAQAAPLSSEQRRIVERHAAEGATAAAKLWGNGWQKDAIQHHHERLSGIGYPHGRVEVQIPTFPRLLAVCDVYAALTAPRPHRLAVDSRAALTEVLLDAERGALDRHQAERLLGLSFYPIGSVVELNDGAVAMVIATHPGPRGLTNPTRPIVTLLREAQGQQPPLPAVLDLLELEGRHVVRGLTASERRQLLLRSYPQLV